MLRSKLMFITFVDFQTAYDFIDRETLIDKMKEYGIDQKTIKLIKLNFNKHILKNNIFRQNQ